MRVAMVCLGNICRSPMAAAVTGALLAAEGLAEQVSVESFGTGSYHVGECADPKADAALRRGGWPAGDHRARRITASDVEAADLVLCADRSNLLEVRRLAGERADGKIRLLRSYDPESTADDLDVPDPWGAGDAAFDRTLAVVARACRGLVRELASTRR